MLSRSVFLLLIIAIDWATVVLSDAFCPILNTCETLPTELQRWDCINEFIFSSTRPVFNSIDNSDLNEKFVEFNCGGVGWGNSIRAYYAGVSLAIATGRRLIVTYPAFNRNFLPPNDSNSDWRYGIKLQPHHISYHLSDQFDFSKYGQSPGRYTQWSNLMKQNSTEVQYNKQILSTGLCGGEGELLTTGGCINRILKHFSKCSREDQVSMNIPFFYYLFRRPGLFIQKKLNLIRKRLKLPPAENDDYHRGIRSSDYYILALHFRRIPLGFEPQAPDLNKGDGLAMRLQALEAFWIYSLKASKRAKDIASCRKQELLIYFASDDVSLRKIATQRLSIHGRVVFGLTPGEVGHVAAQWVDREFEISAVEKVVNDLDTNIDSDDLLEKMTHSRKNAEFLGDMSMVEWWILAHSHWLISSGFTSFSTSAGGVGFGPTGAMERLDQVYSKNNVVTIFRKDFSKASCPQVGAADGSFAQICPNTADAANRML